MSKLEPMNLLTNSLFVKMLTRGYRPSQHPYMKLRSTNFAESIEKKKNICAICVWEQVNRLPRSSYVSRVSKKKKKKSACQKYQKKKKEKSTNKNNSVTVSFFSCNLKRIFSALLFKPCRRNTYPRHDAHRVSRALENETST